MNILFLETQFFGSHKAFLEGLQQHSQHAIYPITTVPAKGKEGGGAVALQRRVKPLQQEFDLIISSNAEGLSSFLALTNPRFAQTPILIYLHENPFSSPLSDAEERNLVRCYQHYVNLLCANCVVFSSAFHLERFFESAENLLPKLPDFELQSTLESIRSKSVVMHPGLNLRAHDQIPDRRGHSRPRFVWNQRWVSEKNPDLFFTMMNRLDDAGFDFELILAGDNRGERPPAFEKAWKRYGDRIIHMGFVDDFQSYSKLLHSADFVLSTAKHEYFSVSVMEAIYCGCHPFLPNKLTYPELIPRHLQRPLLHAPVIYEDEDELFKHIRGVLLGQNKVLPKTSLQTIGRHLDWSDRISEFDKLFSEVVLSKTD